MQAEGGEVQLGVWTGVPVWGQPGSLLPAGRDGSHLQDGRQTPAADQQAARAGLTKSGPDTPAQRHGGQEESGAQVEMNVFTCCVGNIWN